MKRGPTVQPGKGIDKTAKKDFPDFLLWCCIWDRKRGEDVRRGSHRIHVSFRAHATRDRNVDTGLSGVYYLDWSAGIYKELQWVFCSVILVVHTFYPYSTCNFSVALSGMFISLFSLETLIFLNKYQQFYFHSCAICYMHSALAVRDYYCPYIPCNVTSTVPSSRKCASRRRAGKNQCSINNKSWKLTPFNTSWNNMEPSKKLLQDGFAFLRAHHPLQVLLQTRGNVESIGDRRRIGVLQTIV
jgi:hypothetical protein